MHMTKPKWTAIRLTTEAVAVLAVSIYVVVRYGAQIEAVNWIAVSAICLIAVGIFAMYRMQVHETTYDVMDMLMKDGKADLNAHFQIASFVLATWIVVQQAIAKAPVTELMLGILGIFVLKSTARGFSDAMWRRGPPLDSHDTIIQPNATVQTGTGQQPVGQQPSTPQGDASREPPYHAP